MAFALIRHVEKFCQACISKSFLLSIIWLFPYSFFHHFMNMFEVLREQNVNITKRILLETYLLIYTRSSSKTLEILRNGLVLLFILASLLSLDGCVLTLLGNSKHRNFAFGISFETAVCSKLLSCFLIRNKSNLLAN